MTNDKAPRISPRELAREIDTHYRKHFLGWPPERDEVTQRVHEEAIAELIAAHCAAQPAPISSKRISELARHAARRGSCDTTRMQMEVDAVIRIALAESAAQPAPEEEQPSWMDDNILICGEHSIMFTKERDECFVCTNRATQPEQSRVEEQPVTARELANFDVHKAELDKWSKRAKAAESGVEELRKALEGVVRVADRKTVEFDAARAALAASPSLAPTLFQRAPVTLHSGGQSDFKIDCDSLTDADLDCIAYELSKRLPPFSEVVGVPRGGLRLAEKLRPYGNTAGAKTLIVDDVLTTGASMEERRNGQDVIGAVIFARRKYPAWVTPFAIIGDAVQFTPMDALRRLSVAATAMIDALCGPAGSASVREKKALGELDALCEANDEVRRLLAGETP